MKGQWPEPFENPVESRCCGGLVLCVNHSLGISEISLPPLPRCPVLFPLTPPLSRREREYMAQPEACCRSHSRREREYMAQPEACCRSLSRREREYMAKKVSRLVSPHPTPLPEGEGVIWRNLRHAVAPSPAGRGSNMAKPEACRRSLSRWERGGVRGKVNMINGFSRHSECLGQH